MEAGLVYRYLMEFCRARVGLVEPVKLTGAGWSSMEVGGPDWRLVFGGNGWPWTWLGGDRKALWSFSELDRAGWNSPEFTEGQKSRVALVSPVVLAGAHWSWPKLVGAQ